MAYWQSIVTKFAIILAGKQSIKNIIKTAEQLLKHNKFRQI